MGFELAELLSRQQSVASWGHLGSIEFTEGFHRTFSMIPSVNNLEANTTSDRQDRVARK
jgi:hypothetical protein